MIRSWFWVAASQESNFPADARCHLLPFSVNLRSVAVRVVSGLTALGIGLRILDIQADVARRVAGSLALELLPSEPLARARAATDVTEAYDEYLRGRKQWSHFNVEGYRLAVFKWGADIPLIHVPEGLRAIPIVVCGAFIVLFSIGHLVNLLRGVEEHSSLVD